MYRVGQKVKIRKDIKAGRLYPYGEKGWKMDVTYDMKSYAGQVVTLKEVSHTGWWLIEEDCEKYHWVPAMFENEGQAYEEV